jgi:hypothetical protein
VSVSERERDAEPTPGIVQRSKGDDDAPCYLDLDEQAQ